MANQNLVYAESNYSGNKTGGIMPLPVLKVSELISELVTENTTEITRLTLNPAELIGESVRTYSAEELDELVTSIKDVGLITAIVVVKRGEKYEVTAGFKRWKAAIKAGLTEIDVVVEQSPSEIDPVRLAKFRMLQESVWRMNDAVGEILFLIESYLDQPVAAVFTVLAEIEELFAMLSAEQLSAVQMLQKKTLRQCYSVYKRKLNQQAKKQTKYLLDIGLSGLQIGFKFDGQWYAVDSNPPRNLTKVQQAWRIALDEVLDPDQL
jgi:hypothetical protein